jgi:acetyl esterase/lipase
MSFLRFAPWCLGLSLVASGVAQPVPLRPLDTPPPVGAELGGIALIEAYAPAVEQANGSSLLILPGGGYRSLARHEGEGYARWFAARGYAAYVLYYRLGRAGHRHPAMWEDASRALRFVRAEARAAGRDPTRIGVIGSSAGGHLAATLLTGFDVGDSQAEDPVERESSRPDFGILCYPVITLMGPFAHYGSRDNLLGRDATADMVEALSAETRVRADMPPCFIWHAADDKVVPVENALLFASALGRSGVAFELHIYERGGHGAGLPANNRKAPPWDEALLRWLRVGRLDGGAGTP